MIIVRRDNDQLIRDTLGTIARMSTYMEHYAMEQDIDGVNSAYDSIQKYMTVLNNSNERSKNGKPV